MVTKMLMTFDDNSDVVQEMIRFPKLLIAAVNGNYLLQVWYPKEWLSHPWVTGPSIGFGTTTLALCDVVYAAPDATFTTPFMKLGKGDGYFLLWDMEGLMLLELCRFLCWRMLISFIPKVSSKSLIALSTSQ